MRPSNARAKGPARIHLIGHGLGGIIARAVGSQRQRDIASVTTLGSPFRGTMVHPSYTGRCTCDFLGSLRRDLQMSRSPAPVANRLAANVSRKRAKKPA